MKGTMLILVVGLIILLTPSASQGNSTKVTIPDASYMHGNIQTQLKIAKQTYGKNTESVLDLQTSALITTSTKKPRDGMDRVLELMKVGEVLEEDEAQTSSESSEEQGETRLQQMISKMVKTAVAKQFFERHKTILAAKLVHKDTMPRVQPFLFQSPPLGRMHAAGFKSLNLPFQNPWMPKQFGSIFNREQRVMQESGIGYPASGHISTRQPIPYSQNEKAERVPVEPSVQIPYPPPNKAALPPKVYNLRTLEVPPFL